MARQLRRPCKNFRITPLWPLMLAIVSIAMALGRPACADENPYDGTFSFILENDKFYNTDRHYTNGVRFVWLPQRDVPPPAWSVRLARLVPWFPREGDIRHVYTLGQSMYVPDDITKKDPPRDERPYAGWLYGQIGLGVESGRNLDLFGLTMGVVGPASRAEDTQKFVHKLVGVDEPKGWGTQLGNELGLVLTYQHIWRSLAVASIFDNQLDFTSYGGAVLGNIFTYADAGLTVRYGRELPRDFGPPSIRPGRESPGDFSPVERNGWYVFASAEGRAVARNIFLDGNTFRHSRSVEKKPFVGDYQFGLVMSWSGVRLSYTQVTRTREYVTQGTRDSYGALGLSVQF